jgi:hypothetical protein
MLIWKKNSSSVILEFYLVFYIFFLIFYFFDFFEFMNSKFDDFWIQAGPNPLNFDKFR